MEDASEPDLPGMRAALTDPGAAVPLLYGRVAELMRRDEAGVHSERLPFDDPESPTFDAFFSALRAACERDVRPLVRVPTGAFVPGCGGAGVFEAEVHACQAQTGEGLAQPASSVGLTQDKDGWHVAARSEGEGPAWWSGSAAHGGRASWALYAVSEWRKSAYAFARAFDLEACGGLPDGETAAGRALASEAARDWQRALAKLEAATAQADAHLAAAMRASKLDDSPAARIALTRGLNGSLLERQKLYAAIPLGAFEPAEPTSVQPPGRYPAWQRPAPRAQAAAAFLAALEVNPLRDGDLWQAQGLVANGSALSRRVLGSLQRAEPLVFGALDAAEVAVAKFGFTPAELVLGATFWVERMALRGEGARALPTLRAASDEPWQLGPPVAAYAYAITEGALSASDDPEQYAQRGLAHALEYSRRIARAAVASGRAGAAEAVLSALGRGTESARAELCVAPVEARERDTEQGEWVVALRVLDGTASTRAASEQRYELFRSEAGVACALTGRVGAAACDERAYRVAATAFDANDRSLTFESFAGGPRPTTRRAYLTARANSSGPRALVFGFSIDPFTVPTQTRCASYPLSAEMMEQMRRVHDDAPLPMLERNPPLPAHESRFELADRDAVPMTWGQTVEVRAVHEEWQVDLAQRESSRFQELRRALLAPCVLERRDGLSGPLECNEAGLGRVAEARCVASVARALAQGERDWQVGDWELRAGSADGLSVSLWALDESRRALAMLAELVDPQSCPSHTDDERSLRAQLAVELGEAELARLLADEARIRGALEARIERRREASETLSAAVLVRRDEADSQLALARLYVAVPYHLYGGASSDLASALRDARQRFPVLTAPAQNAEDTRAESFLRDAGLDVLLSDRAFGELGYDYEALAGDIRAGVLAERLRAALLRTEPAVYADSPAGAAQFLSFIGLSSSELSAAAQRIVELGEARGAAILPTAGERALGLRAGQPAPSPLHLYALTEGRLAGRFDARGLSARGFYHTLSQFGGAARRALAAVPGGTTSRARDLLSHLAELVAFDPVHIEQDAAQDGLGVTLDLPLPAGAKAQQWAGGVELIASDLGLRCALTGNLDGEPCDASQFRFDSADVVLQHVRAAWPGEPDRVRMRGFRLPEPALWSPQRSDALTEGRLYALLRDGDDVQVLASATLHSGHVGQALGLHSPALDERLVALLAHDERGESCASCRPASVCERARCELGVCVRENAREGLVCSAQGQCVGGVCSAPGCGDGVLADGTGAVPYEACDDGNLFSGDGCSTSCEPELARLEPTLREGYVAGPAPAIAFAGSGRGMVVYTADDFVSDNVAIKLVALDEFGSVFERPTTLDELPRGSQAQPTIVGLRDGGFVVAYAKGSLAGGSDAVFRLVNASGAVGGAIAVDESGAYQSAVRITAIDAGFAVAWLERGAASARPELRLRTFTAEGAPLIDARVVARSDEALEVVEPAIAGSAGQLLLAWSELDVASGVRLGIRAQRVTSRALPVDSAPFRVYDGDALEPALAVLSSGDYGLAYSDRSLDVEGDIYALRLRRFGPALEQAQIEPVALLAGPDTRPVIAALGPDAYAVAHRHGSGPALTMLTATAAEPALVAPLAQELAYSSDGDVSLVSDPRGGVWAAFSERTGEGRALYVYRLPAR